MANGGSGLAINNEVIARMTEMATLETEGVIGMSKGPISMPKILGKKGGTKAVTVTTDQGIIDIELFVKVSDKYRVCDIAEKIQAGVKEKLQGMTGSAVTRVNVVVTDVKLSEEKQFKKLAVALKV